MLTFESHFPFFGHWCVIDSHGVGPKFFPSTVPSHRHRLLSSPFWPYHWLQLASRWFLVLLCLSFPLAGPVPHEWHDLQNNARYVRAIWVWLFQHIQQWAWLEAAFSPSRFLRDPFLFFAGSTLASTFPPPWYNSNQIFFWIHSTLFSKNIVAQNHWNLGIMQG